MHPPSYCPKYQTTHSGPHRHCQSLPRSPVHTDTHWRQHWEQIHPPSYCPKYQTAHSGPHRHIASLNFRQSYCRIGNHKQTIEWYQLWTFGDLERPLARMSRLQYSSKSNTKTVEDRAKFTIMNMRKSNTIQQMMPFPTTLNVPKVK